LRFLTVLLMLLATLAAGCDGMKDKDKGKYTGLDRPRPTGGEK
jgi:hypothetical protein